MFFLLQTDSTSTGGETARTFWQYLAMGDWPMIPIGILLVIAIFIFIERYLTIRKSNEDPEPVLQEVRRLVHGGEINAAQSYCQTHGSPFARMISKGISRLGQPLTDIEASIENVGKLEVYRLEKRLSILATIAGAAPMIGFFGTVMGMMKAFEEISISKGNVNPGDLANGIYEAMTTTAFGLLVGILGLLAYNILVSMVDNVVYKLELTSNDFIDLLQEPAK